MCGVISDMSSSLRIVNVNAGGVRYWWSNIHSMILVAKYWWFDIASRLFSVSNIVILMAQSCQYDKTPVIILAAV